MEKAKYYFLQWGWNNIFIFGGILAAGLAISFYLMLGRGAAAALTEQLLHREQVITRSGAKYLESYFAVVSRSVVVLANSEDLKEQGTNTHTLLNKFIDTWTDTSFVGVLVADSEGIVQYTGNRARISSQGESVRDREYFNWALDAKEWDVKVFSPVISRLGETRGKYIIPIAAPILDGGGSFKGVATAAVLISDLAHDYVAPLQISDQTRSYLVAENGEVWFGSGGDLVGKNVLDELTGSFLGSDVLKSKVGGFEQPHGGKNRSGLAAIWGRENPANISGGLFSLNSGIQTRVFGPGHPQKRCLSLCGTALYAPNGHAVCGLWGHVGYQHSGVQTKRQGGRTSAA